MQIGKKIKERKEKKIMYKSGKVNSKLSFARRSAPTIVQCNYVFYYYYCYQNK